MKQTAALVVAVVTLAGCGAQSTDDPIATPSATSASPTPSETPIGPTLLTKAAAASVYLEAICPANRAKDAYASAVDKYDASDEDVAPSKQARKAAGKAADAYAETARVLTDEQYQWPKKVRAAVDRIATYYFETSASYRAASKRGVTWDDIYFDQSGTFPTDVAKVRLTLDLPPAGEGCDSY